MCSCPYYYWTRFSDKISPHLQKKNLLFKGNDVETSQLKVQIETNILIFEQAGVKLQLSKRPPQMCEWSLQVSVLVSSWILFSV